MSPKTVHFSITGEALTRIARDGMLSERPAWAWRLLVDGLIGDGGENIARQVLEGKLKLVSDGDDSVTTEPEDPNDPETQQYLSELAYVYAGRCRVMGRWWKPRAKVTSFGREDIGGSMILKRIRGSGSRASTPREMAIERASHYAGPEERVFEVSIDESADESSCGNPHCGVCATTGYDYVVFEPCSEPPHWRREVTDPTVAFHDFKLAGRILEEDGWFARYHIEPGAKTVAELPDEHADAVDLMKRKCREVEDDKRHKDFLNECVEISAKVRVRANGDTFLLETKDGRSWPVPRAPFEQWALGRTSLKHLATPWVPVSHSGMKLPLDNPNHTDWMLGAGIGISSNSYWDQQIRDAASEATVTLQQKLGRFRAMVVVDGGHEVTGVVGKDILVLPDMRPDHVEAMLASRAVIAEVGGAGAHLAQLAAEHNKTVMIVKDATSRYLPGTTLTLIPAEGRIETFTTYEEHQDGTWQG